MPTTAYCPTCSHFWTTDRYDGIHVGRCHRFPPVYIPAVPQTLQLGEWRYPKVTAGDSCGEHKPSDGQDATRPA